MYHPTRGGVRGGRDQFSWDDVKVDKHRENFLGHSIKAPVGRWQKGKDLHWYTRDKKSQSSDDGLKDEIKRIKEEEEQAMREALGLAPKRASKPQGNRLDKHELSELVKRGSTAEDVGAGHAEAAWVHGVGFARAPRPWEDPTTLQSSVEEVSPEMVKPAVPNPPVEKPEKDELEDESKRKKRNSEKDELEDESSRKKKRREEKRHEKHERREKRHSRDSDDKRKHRKDKQKRRHDSE
ncbi:hypothetical protein EZV62_025179 [Acer yangbiense]|uniref:Multiple myeloma tumor-associated protein 2-like N-terminal domain-containing protein n=1 Tax=Acer yangbiense TaxID=1000413 RepID=A0A5C7GX22_9ROSI|nr:hypothetical protein EZV62_025179 [Acer yangbiense]